MTQKKVFGLKDDERIMYTMQRAESEGISTEELYKKLSEVFQCTVDQVERRHRRLVNKENRENRKTTDADQLVMKLKRIKRESKRVDKYKESYELLKKEHEKLKREYHALEVEHSKLIKTVEDVLELN